MFLMSKKSNVRGSYSTCTTKLATLQSKHSQSALEYMMTYGWAILIIVIVAAGLYSLGIFNPSSSAGASITGFSGLGAQAACLDGTVALQLTNGIGYPINITKINYTISSGQIISENFTKVITPQTSNIYPLIGGCSNSSGSRYSSMISIAYTEPGQTFSGPYFSKGTISNLFSTANPGLVANFSTSSINITSAGPFADSAFTVTVWIKTPGNGGNNAIISSYNGGSYNILYAGENFSNGPYPTNAMRTFGASADIYTGDVKELVNGRWHFIALTVSNSGALVAFFDGIQNATGSGAAIFVGRTEYIGAIGPGPSQYFIGKIADLAVYKTVLTPAQVLSLYNEGLGGPPLPNSELNSWWPLDGNANDYSGNNNNGVATNVNWVPP